MTSDLVRILFLPSTLVVWAALSVCLALSGPFGTYAAPLPQRLAIWPLVVGAGMTSGIALQLSIRRLRPGIPRWQRSVLGAGGLSAVLVLPAQYLVGGLGAGAVLPGAFDMALAIFAFALGLSLLHIRAIPRPGSSVAPALLSRLPEGQRGAVIRLSSSDHYVRVVTDLGASEVLIRFADAIAELGGVEGMRVHRSHWVALAAVTGARRDNGRLFLTLRDGSEVPVSRRYRDAVEASGHVPGASEARPPALR
ncbi:LytTR family transcriptional regulator [Rhodovulum euryhalinum]|uniref:LytTR family transcriptional regulator n=2 Tax=Rhodovulum euryhalinum TaxID=35805 RepID=A0A4V2SAY9_9RHOB|nr:LytTR family transcriptional regulator [Rhodovulum euryhalinum]